MGKGAGPSQGQTVPIRSLARQAGAEVQGGERVTEMCTPLLWCGLALCTGSHLTRKSQEGST